MARKRMISPEMWQSEDFSKLSILARLVFIGLFSNADDEGKGRAKPVYLKSILFPYDEKIRVTDIDKTLDEIGSKMSITFFKDNDNEYYVLNNWKKWQVINRPTPSSLPSFSKDSKRIRCKSKSDSVMTHGGLTEDSHLIEKNRKEKKEKENNIYSQARQAGVDIMTYFNNSLNTNFKADSDYILKLISARINDGFTVNDFKTVIDKKKAEWINTDMEKYLRPQTLFGTKFESYLNQKSEKKKDSVGNINDSLDDDYFKEIERKLGI